MADFYLPLFSNILNDGNVGKKIIVNANHPPAKHPPTGIKKLSMVTHS